MATEILRPSAAGDECNIDKQHGSICPDHWENVDEVTPDSTTTDVYTSGTSYLLDLYNIENHSVGSDTINSIKVYCYIYAYGEGNLAKVAIKSGTGSGNPDTLREEGKAVAGNWTYYSHQWNTNPATTAAWTWDEIDRLQIGVSLKATSSNWLNCTQVYVEVDYTSVSAPTVTTQAVSSISTTTSTGNVTITATGGENCSKRGICWNTTGSPDVNDDKSEGTDSFGTGAFTRSMTSLASPMKFYAKGYAYNSAGYGYGGEVTFVTHCTSSVSIGIVTSASRSVAYTRASLVALGIVVSASRIYGRVRSSTVTIGIVTTASRSLALIRSASTTIGIVTTASRSLALARASSVAIGIVTTASRALALTRASSVAIGIAISASRAVTYTRTASVTIGISVSVVVSYILDWIKLTLRKRKVSLTLNKRSLSLTLKKRSISLTLVKRE